jgi:hypothetical protein
MVAGLGNELNSGLHAPHQAAQTEIEAATILGSKPLNGEERWYYRLK